MLPDLLFEPSLFTMSLNNCGVMRWIGSAGEILQLGTIKILTGVSVSPRRSVHVQCYRIRPTQTPAIKKWLSLLNSLISVKFEPSFPDNLFFISLIEANGSFVSGTCLGIPSYDFHFSLF